MRWPCVPMFVYVVAAGCWLIASPSKAQAGGTGSVACGSSPAAWNVPAGALVLSRSPGPVNGVITALGEYRTHSMLAHGNGWVSHAAMYTPGTSGWPAYCSTPVNADELKNGYPGASQIQEGGIYQFLYGGGVEHVAFQRGCDATTCPNDDGRTIADWLWFSMPYQWSPSRQSGGGRGQGDDGLYRIEMGTPAALTAYSLYQFRDLQGVNSGGATWNNGIVCTTLLAYAHFKAGKGIVAPYVYPHEQLVRGITGLVGAVEDECNRGVGFWKGLGANITCLEGICDDAARQVTNCMTVGRCDTDTSGANSFASVRDDPASTARSISPDRLGGWSGHPSEGYREGSGVSVWAADSEQAVQWNAPGNVYGCWF